MLGILADDGGVTPVPDFVNGKTFRTLGEFALTWIMAMETEQVCSEGLWIPYINMIARRVTFAPLDVVSMAAEKATVDGGCYFIGMPS